MYHLVKTIEIMSLLKFIGHTIAVSSSPFKGCEKLQEKYGDPFYLHLSPNKPILISGQEEAAKVILSPIKTRFKKMDADMMEVLLSEESIILKYGEEHISQKKMLIPLFYEKDNLIQYQKTMEEEVIMMIDKWHAGQIINLGQKMIEITLRIIVNVIFGAKGEAEALILTRKTKDLLDAYTPLVMFAPRLRLKCFPHWRKFTKAKKAFNELLLNKIYKERESSNHDDNVLTKLVNIKPEDGAGFSDPFLIAQLLTLLIGGHDTTAHSLTWGILHILREPDIKNRLLEELNSSSSQNKLDDLPYLDATCKEILRLHPPVPMILRTLNQILEFAGITCQPDSSIGLSTYLLHTNPKLWSEPKRFNPERFLNKQINQFHYCPFGGGLKRCLGSSFAMMEMKVILSKILQNSKLELVDSDIPETKLLGLVVGAKKPIMVKVL
jgi:cytochrome P450